MKTIDLCGLWRMHGGGYSVEGNIPGSVYSFLHIDNEILPDPHFGENEDIYLSLAGEEFTFEREFEYSKQDSPVFLVFEGLDTLCSVYLNGAIVAETDNMHIRYSFDVTDILLDGENSIKVVCHPIAPFIKEKNAQARLFGATDCMEGYPYIRKAHSMMGWDWGPRLPDAGIWRAVCLIEKNSAEIIDVELLQRHEDGKAFVTPNVECDGGEIEVRLTSPNGKITVLEANRETEIEAPALWMPNGLGEQNLYKVEIILRQNGEICDRKTKKIGLREMKLVRRADEFGESFYHEINGVPMFAMGADYIPEDNIFSRITYERTKELLTHCKNCNFNAIRVWGGGYYPDDYFFDICDELGLVVFFDLMFACSVYDPDEKMMESIALEVEQNLRRIRHHACIGLVCGNNEIEWHFHDYVSISGREDREYLTDVYLEIFEKRIPEIVARVAPNLAYIPSSPTSFGTFADPNGEASGDCHDWDSDYLTFRNKHYRYVSEFGFQSLPDIKTVESFTLPEDRNIYSRVMEKHQRSFGGNELILTQMTRLLRYPISFEGLVYATQVYQAESIRYRVEHLRRNRGRCMGALYWQLNDIWPCTSWASIDYYGRFKALQYAAKRFYAPVLISCCETGELQRVCYVNAEKQVGGDVEAKIFVTNDTLQDVCGKVVWKICDRDSRVISCGEKDVRIEALSAKCVVELQLPDVDPRRDHISFAIISDGECLSEGSVLFTPPKHYGFADPHLSLSVCGDVITVKSEAFAKFVWISGDDIVLEDNCFDMEAGERNIRILSGNAENLTVCSVYDL